jgi:hypothetical protein
MTEMRERRLQQLEILMKTINGRERILDAYRRACLKPGEQEPLDLPMRTIIEAILDAEFPPPDHNSSPRT